MDIIIATPSCSGNGFVEGTYYTFTPLLDIPNPASVYTCTLPNGWERVVSRESLLEGTKSAHLWDGVHWSKAGNFIIKEKDKS